MKRKRLQHAAEALCQIFCGWRLDESRARLALLGSGTLEIDVLTGKCLFGGQAIEQLPIARELQAWLLEDLTAHHIPAEDLKTARIRAIIKFSLVAWRDRQKTAIYYKDGRPLQTSQVQRCEIDCDGEITTDEKVYRSRIQDLEEWPTD